MISVHLKSIPLALATLSATAPLPAQDPAVVEAIAPILMAEDRRAFDGPLFARGVVHPEFVVRRAAVLAIGRIADAAGTTIVVSLLNSRDFDLHGDVFFALGLIRDTTSVAPIIARLRSPDSLTAGAAAEAVTALAKTGGPAAARFLAEVLGSGTDLPRGRRDQMLAAALLETRRLGALAATNVLVQYAGDVDADLRWRAVYALGRLLDPAGGEVVLRAMRDETPLIRETAARSLTRRYVDTTRLAPDAVRRELARAFDDQAPGVRINALGAAATFADSFFTRRAVRLLRDPDPNVRVAAATALGEFRGAAAVTELDSVFERRDGTWAVRRAALFALAKLDSAHFVSRASTWQRSPDWRDRVAAIGAWGTRRGTEREVFNGALVDTDARVRGAALGAWRAARTRGDSQVAAAARALLRDPDDGVRSAAINALGTDATSADTPALLAAWALSLGDDGGDARLELLRVIGSIVRADSTVWRQLDDGTARSFTRRPHDEVLRRTAESSWPELALLWGPAWPIATGRSLDDYRGVARTIMLARENAKVVFDVEGRGSIEIELLGRDAPLTVANFLRLVDRRYFDGNRWHRVVPNFVVQDGDRSGTGSGGPGWAIRDEINRWRYDVPMLGMALSGPDTGGSQWFINLSPQPHLDGTYAVFGRVIGSYNALRRVVQGDVIRSVRR